MIDETPKSLPQKNASSMLAYRLRNKLVTDLDLRAKNEAAANMPSATVTRL